MIKEINYFHILDSRLSDVLLPTKIWKNGHPKERDFSVIGLP